MRRMGHAYCALHHYEESGGSRSGGIFHGIFLGSDSVPIGIGRADRFRAVSGRLWWIQRSLPWFFSSEGCGGNTHISGAAAAKGCRSPPGLQPKDGFVFQMRHEKRKTIKHVPSGELT